MIPRSIVEQGQTMYRRSYYGRIYLKQRHGCQGSKLRTLPGVKNLYPGGHVAPLQQSVYDFK
jgi:hypothetical protein